MAGRLRTGQVDVNGGLFNPLAPVGGYGRAAMAASSAYGVEEFKSIRRP